MESAKSGAMFGAGGGSAGGFAAPYLERVFLDYLISRLERLLTSLGFLLRPLRLFVAPLARAVICKTQLLLSSRPAERA
jgi:hypothetical protein